MPLMFEELAAHRRIAVTGPQRSGTTIVGQIIASDTGHRYIDELFFGIYGVEEWREALTRDRVVVQCPHMLKLIVDSPPPDVFVVLVRRDLSAIHASERRVGWEATMQGNSKELAPFSLTEGDSAQIKYDYWDSQPKNFPFLEVEYDSIQTHPLFVDSLQRHSFRAKQTKIDR
jgi:hypothetical protein